MFAGLDAVHTQPARRWTALVSFTFQAALVGAALVLPLFKPASLSEAFARRLIFRPISAAVEHAPETQIRTGTAATSHAPVFPLLVRIGPSIQAQNTRPSDSNVTGPPQIEAYGDPNGVVGSILNLHDAQSMPPRPASAPAHHVAPVSVIMEGNLERKIEPRYPMIARQAGIQGTVSIKALISRQGTIERAQVISGSPLLSTAALDAVRQWKYRPYYLNGEPVEVETEITVNFVLNR